MTSLEDAYAAAFEEWETAAESLVWDEAIADEIEMPTRVALSSTSDVRSSEHP